MSATTSAPAGGVQTVRRLITYALLFVMVVIAGMGLSGLLDRLLNAGNALVAEDRGGLAQSLAFALIAGPLAAVLWWLVWRGLATGADRRSVAWAIYLVLMSTVALITFSTALLSATAALVAGDWQPSGFATGVVWALVWLWHRWMLSHGSRGPTRLVGVATALGSLIALVILVAGFVGALTGVFDAAADSVLDTITVGGHWWQPVLQSLVWAVGGGLLWWWHWMRASAREQQTGFSCVLLVLIAGLGSVALCLTGVGTVLFVLLRLAIDTGRPLAELVDPLGQGLAAAAIGSVVWIYHRRIVALRPIAVRAATTLVTSGVGLAAAASGLGIVVNSILAAIGTPLADMGVRTLLLGGISALLVGGIVWWLWWKPLASGPERAATPGRRVYLVVVFGASAIVALITLLVIGFRLFEFALDDATGASLLERTRAPLGLITATALVAGYHFAIWRRSRLAGEESGEARRALRRVILVAGEPEEELAAAITQATGARVTVWRRAIGDDRHVETEPLGIEEMSRALSEVESAAALVIAGPGSRLEVIPLEE